MFEQTKALCDHFLAMGIPGFDLAVYKDGKCVLRYMGGYADPENKIPMSGKEKYHIYSCSKLLTCVAAMQLWEKGLFRLEDELADYIPEFKNMVVKTEDGVRPAKNPIRIHNLFEMTSGMNYNLWTPELREFYIADERRCATLDVVKRLARTPLEFDPGEGWYYSLSHDVLAGLVEVLSGQKFNDYVKEHIFDPLGMENSTFLHPREDWEGFAKQYRYNAETKVFEPWAKNIYRPGREYASGGAGCVSTVDDFMKFLEALRIGDVILKKETIALMRKDRLTEKQRGMYTYGASKTVGYGLGMRASREGTTRTEFGWGGAAGAYASVDYVNNVTIYYAQHVLLSPNAALRGYLYSMVKADLQGRKYEIPNLNLQISPDITY